MHCWAFSLPSYHFQITLFLDIQENFKIITYDYRDKGYLRIVFLLGRGRMELMDGENSWGFSRGREWSKLSCDEEWRVYIIRRALELEGKGRLSSRQLLRQPLRGHVCLFSSVNWVLNRNCDVLLLYRQGPLWELEFEHSIVPSNSRDVLDCLDHIWILDFKHLRALTTQMPGSAFFHLNK